MFDENNLCKKVKKASYEIAGYTAEQKNSMLGAIACALKDADNIARLKSANVIDVNVAISNGKPEPFIDRLTLNDKRIATMIEGLEQVKALPDPVGEIVEKYTVKSGIEISKVRAPLGVIGIIYEARPNVTIDAASLCLKSGNGIVLRGGKDAINSNRVLYEVMSDAIKSIGLNSDCVGFIDDISRDASKVMLEQEGLIDVIIPRGGEGLKNFVLENAKMPVIASAGGNCHIYVEKTADFKQAVDIIVNAKVQRPSTCNATEHLLVDKCIAKEFMPLAYAALKEKGVEVIGDDDAVSILGVEKATDDDYYTEFLALKMTFSTVSGVEEAVDIINATGTKHSEAILSKDDDKMRYFEKYVDAAAVYKNASTRFTDGFEFGLGAEMGISTQKLHARGPIALKELTSQKYVINGHGELRK